MAVASRRGGTLLALAVLGAGLGACQPPRWTMLTSTLDRVVVAAWASGQGDAFVVGGGLGNGAPGLMLHLHGGQWRSIELGTTDTLWWVFGFGGSDVWAVGENGAVYHWDGSAVTRALTPTTATLYGIWGAAPDDLWAVGGSPGKEGASDVLLHYDGATWSRVPPPSVIGVSYFKVWGASRSSVFVVGGNGVVLHYDGSAWTRQGTTTRSPLLAIAGRSGDDVVAVGGPPPALLHYDGQQWLAEPMPFIASGLSGVSFAGSSAFVVGLSGVKWRWAENGAWIDDSAQLPRGDLHAVWSSPDGSALAVGGNYLAASELSTPRRGVVAYYGPNPPPSIQ